MNTCIYIFILCNPVKSADFLFLFYFSQFNLNYSLLHFLQCTSIYPVHLKRPLLENSLVPDEKYTFCTVLTSCTDFISKCVNNLVFGDGDGAWCVEKSRKTRQKVSTSSSGNIRTDKELT